MPTPTPPVRLDPQLSARPARAVRLGWLAGLALALVLAPASSAQLTTVPTDVQLPGTQPSEILPLQPASDCFACHADFDPVTEPGRVWEGSMMAHASRDPLFWAASAVAEQDVPGSGDLCLRCHVPRGWTEGRSTPTDGSALLPADADGIACDVCHRLTNTDWSEHYGTQNAPFIANDGGSPATGWYGAGMYALYGDWSTKFGPYDDAQSPHSTAPSQFHRSADLCGTCHDVSNPVVGDLAPGNGALTPLPPGSFSGQPGTNVSGKAAFNNPPHSYGVVERTYSEHKASALATLSVGAFPSLPGELLDGALADAYAAAIAADPSGDYADGTPRAFSCQTCHMPPVSGKGCSFAEPRVDVPQHDLTGGNYWAPQAIAWLDANNGLILGGGLATKELQSLDSGATRARDTLESAAALDVYGDTLRVVNLTGHKLISGYPEGRRMWVRVRWFDDQDALLREDGGYGTLSVDLAGLPLSVESLLDPEAPQLTVFEAHHAVSQEWATQLMNLGIPGTLPLAFDRLDGSVTATLADAAAGAPGSSLESFHFALNDTVLGDNRIPPYGFDHDEALTRNALPAPATQYGNPGPGGSYRHWAEVELDPPAGADHASIELLYQPTSWEYVQFLALANTGAVTHLADAGSDLLDAWLNTGMAAPHVMATTTWTAGASVAPWTDLGQAMAGSVGAPLLSGAGPAIPGQSVSVSLENAPPSTGAWLVVGFSEINAPAKGGVLVPAADFLLPGLPVTSEGTFSTLFTWPAGSPSGVPITLQYWIPDPGGPAGFAASNGLRVVTP